MRNALHDFEEVKVAGRSVTNLRFADDVVLIAANMTELQELVDQGWPTCGPFSLMLRPSTLALSYTSVRPFLWYCLALFPPPWLALCQLKLCGRVKAHNSNQ